MGGGGGGGGRQIPCDLELGASFESIKRQIILNVYDMWEAKRVLECTCKFYKLTGVGVFKEQTSVLYRCLQV